MDFVKRCIDAMHEHGGEGLLLADGKHPVMRVQGKVQRISRTPTTAEVLAGFLAGELGQAPDSPDAAAPGAFAYHGTAAPVMVKKVFTDEGLSLQIYPLPAAARAQAPAAAPVEASAMASAAPQAAGPAERPRILELLTLMIDQGASDLHLCTGTPPYLRKDGEMVALDRPPFTNEELHALLMEIIPGRNRTEFAAEHDTDFAYEVPDLARFRCNYFQDRQGCGAVFRQIPMEILSVQQLGLPPQLLKLCSLTKGLVLVTGPTGSGKSTTLAALIDHINKTRNAHIITIEDPIEFVHRNQKCLVNQREVSVHTKGFKQALRAALREDPDIVLVGEMRDLETISIAVETAETGHLVFGTLHTTTAVSTIDRIIDQFPAEQQSQIRVMLSESLRGVISQTLCKKQGGGRVAAYEVLLYTRAIGNLIREGKSFQIPSAIQTGKKEGMILLNDALLTLVNSGQISADEAFMRSVDKDGIGPQLADKGLTLAV